MNRVWRSISPFLRGIAFVAVVFLGACLGRNVLEPTKPAQVFIREVKSEEIFDWYNYPARVKAKVNATVLSETDGIISRVLVSLGTKVRTGQTLMILTHTDPVYQYAPVQISAPIGGIVSAIEVTQGSHVTQGQKLAGVIDPSKLEIQVEIPAQDLPFIQKSLVGEFRLSGHEEPIQVKVLGVSPFVDPVTGTALSELELISASKSILSPGVQGQVTFKINLHQGILLPDTSIVYRGKEQFVRVVEEQKSKNIPVVLGKKQKGMVEILKGLTSGMQVIERASRFISEGETVNIENLPTAPTAGSSEVK